MPKNTTRYEKTVDGKQVETIFNAFTLGDKDTPLDAQQGAVVGDDNIKAIDVLHPDIRSALAHTIYDLRSENIQVALTPGSDKSGLDFNLSLVSNQDPATMLQARQKIKEALKAQGFADLGNDKFSTTENPAELAAIAQLPTMTDKDMSGKDHAYPLIPGGRLYNAATDEQKKAITGLFGTQTAAAPAADTPAAAATTGPDTHAKPVNRPATVDADTKDLPLPFEKGTEAPKGTDKWTQNGLYGLKVLTPGMSEEERGKAVNEYLKNAGVTGSGEKGAYTDADLSKQVATDVTQWQTYLNAAEIPKTVSTTTVTETKDYDLGAFGANKDGVDAKFGDYTRAATVDFNRLTGKNPLDILRPKPEATEEQQKTVTEPALTPEQARAKAIADKYFGDHGGVNKYPTQEQAHDDAVPASSITSRDIKDEKIRGGIA